MREKKTELETPNTEDSPVLIELRHEAGLTAGNTMMLQRGRYQFGPTVGEAGGLSAGNPSVVGFELNILAADEIALVPHATTVNVDGRLITQPERVTAGQSIQVGADHFVLGKADSFVALAQRERSEIVVGRIPKLEEQRGSSTWLLWFIVLAVGLLATALHSRRWILLVGAAAIGIAGTWMIRRRHNKREHQRYNAAIVGASASLSEELTEARNLVARQCRAAHLSPTDIVAQSRLAPDEATPAMRSERLDVSLGLGDVAWSPPVAPREHAGWDYKPVVEQYASLSAVPYLLDLNAGPVAIIGDPAATTAIARHLEQSALSVAGQQICITSEVSGNDVVVDATTSTTENSENAPMVYLLERDHPNGCSTVVEITENGFAAVFDKDGNKIALDIVPNGLPASEAPEGLLECDTAGFLDLREGVADEVSPSMGPQKRLGSFLQHAARQTTAGQPTPSFEGIRLYTSDSRIISKESLARTGLELAERSTPEELAITILDSGDRGLIRLRQLEHCVGYATIDDDAGSVGVMNALTAALNAPRGQIQVILAREFPDLLSFLYRSGRASMAGRLAELAEQTSDDELVIVASATSDEPSDEHTAGPSPDINGAVAQLLDVVVAS